MVSRFAYTQCKDDLKNHRVPLADFVVLLQNTDWSEFAHKDLTGFSLGKEAVFCFGGPDMARIPDEELQRIKSQVAVEDLCRDYGIELQRMGPDNLMGRCPFH